jgi:hypothetical protein
MPRPLAPATHSRHSFLTIRLPTLLPALVLTLAAAFGAAGEARLGYPQLTHFDQQQHRGGSQNFALAQDSRGILYFANLRGVVTYDGAWWSLVELPRSAPALSLFVDAADRIGIGSVDDFGLLEPDAQGYLHYRSLLPTLPAAQRENLGEFDYVITDGARLVFVSQKIVVAWNGRASTVLLDTRAHPAPHRPFFSRGQLLFGTRDGLQDLGGGKTFAGQRVDAVTDSFVNVRGVGLFTRNGKPVAGAARNG